jgi:hypothetical protein
MQLVPYDPTTHDVKDIAKTCHAQLFRYHPDSGGSAASPEALNRTIHAHNMLSARDRGAQAYSVPLGCGRLRAAGGAGTAARTGARGATSTNTAVRTAASVTHGGC